MNDINEFKKRIIDNVVPQTATLEKNLEFLKEAKFDPKVEHIDFEIHWDGGRFFSIMLYSMTDDMNEVFKENDKEGSFAGSKAIVDQENLYPEKDNELFQKAFEKLEKTDDAVSDALIEWFDKSWGKLGLKDISIPAFIQLHDTNRKYDLTKKVWINDDQFTNQNLG